VKITDLTPRRSQRIDLGHDLHALAFQRSACNRFPDIEVIALAPYAGVGEPDLDRLGLASDCARPNAFVMTLDGNPGCEVLSIVRNGGSDGVGLVRSRRNDAFLLRPRTRSVVWLKQGGITALHQAHLKSSNGGPP
jgi:hypothetical protein